MLLVIFCSTVYVIDKLTLAYYIVLLFFKQHFINYELLISCLSFLNVSTQRKIKNVWHNQGIHLPLCIIPIT